MIYVVCMFSAVMAAVALKRYLEDTDPLDGAAALFFSLATIVAAILK